MPRQKYLLPNWIQTIALIIFVPMLVLSFIPSFTDLILGKVAVVVVPVFVLFVLIYNKLKTGIWVPGRSNGLEK